MENENVQPSYEELMKAYEELAQRYQMVDDQLRKVMSDSNMERIKLLMHIMEQKECYTNEIIELVEWHLNNALAKPVQK